MLDQLLTVFYLKQNPQEFTTKPNAVMKWPCETGLIRMPTTLTSYRVLPYLVHSYVFVHKVLAIRSIRLPQDNQQKNKSQAYVTYAKKMQQHSGQLA